MAKVYPLIVEGFFYGDDTERYLVGIYDNLDDAIQAQDDYVELLKKENVHPGASDKNIRSLYTKVLEVEEAYMSRGYIIKHDGMDYELILFEEETPGDDERKLLGSIKLTKKTAKDLGQKLIDISKELVI